MTVTTRPTNHELSKKLKEAKTSLKNGNGVFTQPVKVMGELNKLNIGDSDQIWNLSLELLEEISPDDYKGSRPPQRSYEKAIVGQELFAFCWWSSKLSKQMYIKFALKNGRYYYVSLHDSRSNEYEGDD